MEGSQLTSNSQALLGNQFAPTTYRIGFLETSQKRFLDSMIEWFESRSLVPVVNSFKGDLEELLPHIQPLKMPPSRFLILSTKSEWSAYLDNGSTGTDPISTVGYVSRTLKCRGLAVSCIPNTFDKKIGCGTYGSTKFELFADGPREFLNYERSIAATNDGGKWVFVETGAKQDYEETERYRLRRIVDRFTPGMLGRYCTAMGIQLFDNEFYGPNASLLTIGATH